MENKNSNESKKTQTKKTGNTNNGNNSIKWKTLVFVQYDITLVVSYWAKDFTIEYQSKFGPLEFGLHLPYAMPKIYTETGMIEMCKYQWANFLKAEKYIENNQALIEQELQTLKAMDKNEWFSAIWDWTKEHSEENIWQIVRNYIEKQCYSIIP